MKIIKEGNKVKECDKCGCVMQFDANDIKSKLTTVMVSEFFCKSELWNIEYICYPQCKNKIEIDSWCVRS